MAQLPPFRTRRSEPAFFPEAEIDDVPLPTAALDPDDDDVPVLTHVVQPPSPAPAPVAAPVAVPAAAPADVIVEAPFEAPAAILAPAPAAAAPVAASPTPHELDVLARQVVEALQPDLLRLVRGALEQALDARPRD